MRPRHATALSWLLIAGCMQSVSRGAWLLLAPRSRWTALLIIRSRYPGGGKLGISGLKQIASHSCRDSNL
jgi:hypothetical protein